MTARMLVVLLKEQEAAAAQGMATLVALARAERAVVRLAYLHRMPSPRMDRHGRVVADSDREMARITGTVVESLRLAARPYADVEIEAVARFGAPGSELGFELDAFAPTLVTFLTARADGPLARLQPWALRRRLWFRPEVRLIVLETAWWRPEALRRAPASTPLWEFVRMAGGPY
jgi:hypothetical protein